MKICFQGLGNPSKIDSDFVLFCRSTLKCVLEGIWFDFVSFHVSEEFFNQLLNIFDKLYTIANEQIHEVSSVLRNFKNEDYGSELANTRELLSESQKNYDTFYEIKEDISKEITDEDIKARFKDIEKIILPFLYNLSKSDEPYIHWPNRGPIIKAQIEKILKLTRG